MKELADLLNNHRLEIEKLQDKIKDLQAYKDLSIYLANKKGFDSVNDAINSVKPCECGCMVENEVLLGLLSSRWSNRDRPMGMVIGELIGMKENEI